ncbi:M28 family metallopeptidase [Fodinibius halophilus]|uniref:M20/M25/M40 family metallo-hydrolase n=1 Tax=Fodinibius halophilus TaxID=1736908 RepID=A0A6M1T431_9BACT|nr:M28 family metallopeptidase [Fodinibius halophilus]NGP87985.1 M20/M25/M40 family metallo-hydrolase [Fodinibius halophilus]
MILRKNILALLCMLLFLIGGCETEIAKEEVKPGAQLSPILDQISVDSIETNVRKLASFHTRHTTSDTASDSIGIGAARRWIYKKFKEYQKASGGRLKVKYDRYIETENRRIDEPTEIVNVIAKLPGKQLESKDRMYLVSGHYDSRVSDIMDDTSYAPGANDDASGTAAVMELARVMSKYEFDATIIFMTVAGEEQGLLGANHFAEKAKKRNLDIAAMFTNDIIGNTIKSTDGSIHDNEVRIFTQGIPTNKKLSDYHRMLLYTGGENDTPSRQLGRFIHRVAQNIDVKLEPNIIYRKDRYLRGGDHSAFLDEGYPAVRISEPHEYYERQHQDVRKEDGIQYGDLPKFVDYGYVTKVTKLNAAAIATLANAPERPKDVGIDVSKLENNTTLRWEAGNEPDLKGYEIVWRPTHVPLWKDKKFVGDTTQFTIPGVSKDNYLFGVRAVDRMGYKSPAVYPLPYRD